MASITNSRCILGLLLEVIAGFAAGAVVLVASLIC